MAKDVKMFYAEDDIEKIQLKTNMYIQSYGDWGALHLGKEVMQNSIDEINDPNSPGTKMIITYDELDGSLTVEDDGRGFPETDYPLDIFCTKIQSGSKFFREQSGGSSGEFGLGLTVVNALSTRFIVTSYREKEKTAHTLVFENGKKVKDEFKPLPKSKPHGTLLKFIPNQKYLGKGTKIPYDEVYKWLDKMMYQFSDETNITIVLDRCKGFEKLDHKVFKKKDIADLINYIVSSESMLVKPIKLHKKTVVEETIREEVKLKDFTASVVFAYDNDPYMCDSYCNFTNTTDNGVHVDAAEEAICRFLQTKVKASMSEREKDKLDILWVDVKDGLKLIVNLNTDMQVGFVGNAKEKIGNKDIVPIMKSIITDELTTYFDKNPDKLNSIIKVVKANAKARVELNKIKSATTKEKMTSFKENSIPHYTKANNDGKKYRELFIIEGDSAAGSAKQGRDDNTQAFYAVKGVTLNPLKTPMTKIMSEKDGNDEWRNYIRALRCGWGSNFNLDKLHFDKIIIMSDADIDGHGITEGILLFHMVCLPEIVKAGKLYKVVPPLYKIDSKKKPFVRSKSEYVSTYQDTIINNYKVWFGKSEEPVKKSVFKEFILDTVTYQDDLKTTAEHIRANKFLIEMVSAILVSCIKDLDENYDIESWLDKQSNITKLMKPIQKKFPELTYDNAYSIVGPADGKQQLLTIDRTFIRRVKSFFSIYTKWGLYMGVQEKDRDKEVMTIGNFLDVTSKYVPKIQMRYKGLGEMTPSQLWETTLNPDTRILIQMTSEDIEKELEVFNKLNSEKPKYKELRKEMMRQYKINREDLDN